MNLILPLDRAQRHAWRCGAKAATLSRLLAKGFPIPRGFVVTTDAFDLLVRQNGLGTRISETLQGLERETVALGEVAAELKAMIAGAGIPQPISREVSAALGPFGNRPFAVRSSSSLEDRADLSFAGQHDSHLNVMGTDACMDAIRRVWGSLYNAQALSLLKRLGISPHQERMAVLVQVMVPAHWAGVGFTVHPLSGDSNEIVVHALPGLASDCMDGKVAADEITLTREPLALVGKSASTGAESGTLGESTALAVARLMVRIEQTLELGPLDVEWAVTAGASAEDRNVWILQARPITSRPEGCGVQWASPVPGAHWRRGWRLGEWLREPVTPLFATWAIPLLIASRECFGSGTLGWRHPRSFSMPAPWFCLVNGYFYARQDLPAEVGAEMPFAARLRRMKELRTFLRRWSREDLPAYLDRFRDRCSLEIEKLPPAMLVELIDTLLGEAGELWYVIAPLGYGFEEMVFAPHYERLLGPANPPHYSELFRGYPSPCLDAQQFLYELAGRIREDSPAVALMDASSPAELAGDLSRLPAWLCRELEAYHREHGHLVRNLDFYYPTAGEDPKETLAVLTALVHHQVAPPRELLERNRQIREAAEVKVRAMLREYGSEGKDLVVLMDCFQTNAAVREHAIYSFQLGWPLLRRCLASLGRELVDWGALEAWSQIFFLEREEVLGLVASRERGEAPARLAGVARGRHLTWKGRHGLVPPETIPRDVANPQVRRHCGFLDDGEGPRLVGQGVSAGFCRGRVRLVSDATDPICQGDVLVTRTASPVLTPLMILAGALVADFGGGASHSSLVARELGLPAVVNTLEATQRLHDGQLVEVYGGEGIVRLL